jgi:hypothetical protein
MEKIFNILNSLPKDKAYHMLYGLIAYNFIALYSPTLAVLVVIVIAIGKEVYDEYYPNHTSDKMDAIATAIVPIVLYVIEILS